MENTNVSVKFVISGDEFSIQEINRILEILPTVAYAKGEKGEYTTSRKETSWYIGTDFEESFDINDQLKKVYVLIANKKSELIALKKLYRLDYLFSIVVIIKNNQTPAIYLEHDMIEFASYISAEFDFDVYVN
jgi:hypothetical protein